MILRGKRALHAEEAKGLVRGSVLRVGASGSQGRMSSSEVLDVLVDDLASLGTERLRDVLEMPRDLWSEPDRAIRVGQAMVDEAHASRGGSVDVARVYARVLLTESMEIEEVCEAVLSLMPVRVRELDRERSREAMEAAGWKPGHPDAELREVTPEMIDAAWTGYRSNLSPGRVDYPDAPFYGRVWAREDEIDGKTGAVARRYRYLETIDGNVEATFHHGLPLIAANSAASVDEALLLDDALDRMEEVGLLDPTSDEPVDGLRDGMRLTERQFDAFQDFCSSWANLGGPNDHPSNHDPEEGLDTDELPEWEAFRNLVAYTLDDKGRRHVVSNVGDTLDFQSFNSLTCARRYVELLRDGWSKSEERVVVEADRMLFHEKPRECLLGGTFQKIVDGGLYAWNPENGIVVFADASPDGGKYSVKGGNYWVQASLPHAVTPREVMRWTLEEGFDPSDFQLHDKVKGHDSLLINGESMASDTARLAATLDAGGWEVASTAEIVSDALALAIRDLPPAYADSLASRLEGLRHDEGDKSVDAVEVDGDER